MQDFTLNVLRPSSDPIFMLPGTKSHKMPRIFTGRIKKFPSLLTRNHNAKLILFLPPLLVGFMSIKVAENIKIFGATGTLMQVIPKLSQGSCFTR